LLCKQIGKTEKLQKINLKIQKFSKPGVMRWSQNKKNRVKAEFTIPNEQRKGARGVPHQRGRNSRPGALHLLFAGLNRWLVAGKYQSHRVQKTWLTKSNILWLKIGIAGFALLMVMRNDFQFTINLSGNGDQATIQPNDEGGSVNKMGVAQSVALKPKAVRSRKNSVKKASTAARFTAKSVDQYVDHYAEVAQEEMRRFGIPASFKMAQAILASQAGISSSAATYNNHFGRHLKGINFEDDRTNWRAHSLYLIENYPELLSEGSDYMDWINRLEKTDYSVDLNYTQQLLRIIKEYKLYQLDY